MIRLRVRPLRGVMRVRLPDGRIDGERLGVLLRCSRCRWRSSMSWIASCVERLVSSTTRVTTCPVPCVICCTTFSTSPYMLGSP